MEKENKIFGQDALKKEESLFRRDGKEFFPEEIDIWIYDRNLDLEIMQETLLQNQMSKRLEIMKKAAKDEKEKMKIQEVEEIFKESEELVKQMEEMKEKEKEKKTIKIKPCTVSEAQYIQDNKSLKGEEVEDVIAHLIHKKCAEPLYSYDEARDLKADYRIAIKEAILEISGYKTKSYREILLEGNKSKKKKNMKSSNGNETGNELAIISKQNVDTGCGK